VLKLGDFKLSGYKMLWHYYLFIETKSESKSDVFINISVLFKTTEQFIIQLDLSTVFYFRSIYLAGFTYRTGSGGSYGDIIFPGGANMNNIIFSYSFEFILSNIKEYSLGSHEILLAVRLGENPKRHRWLNRY